MGRVGAGHEIFVVWLVDADPPSEIGGGRGFYPVAKNSAPPDPSVMTERFATILQLVEGEAGGDAVITVHTSPRYRDHFYRDPYLSVWRRFLESGATLALHPHEDRADGSSLFDDMEHMDKVLTDCVTWATDAGLHMGAFRAGGFAFHRDLPKRLQQCGIGIDLSAAPGLYNRARCVDWPRTAWKTDFFTPDAKDEALCEIPLGWDFDGCDLDRNYLFNEKTDFAGLCRVWDRLRMRAEAVGTATIVNFLSHGFGLVDANWRRQAISFLNYIRGHGGCVVSAGEARTATFGIPSL